MVPRKPKSVEVGLNLGAVTVAGTWEPSDAERKAAWELYVELITRISVVPLPREQGSLREALSSLYSLFPATREILRRHGPDVATPRGEGEYSFAYLAVAILNLVVRPPLARWHPELEDWESSRAAGVSRYAHEQGWPKAAQLRDDLAATRRYLDRWATLLAEVNDIPDLAAAIPDPPEGHQGGAHG